MTQQIRVGDIVKVTAAGGGLFYSHNAGKTGRVSEIRSNDHVRVDFGAGIGTDYGRMRDLTLVAESASPTKVSVGDRIKVTARHGGVFYSKHEGKEGTVTEVQRDTITVRFDHDNTVDYGDISDLILLPVPKARKSNETNNGWAIGDRVQVKVGRGERGSFFERHERKIGVITEVLASGEAVSVRFEDGGSDCGYTKGLTLVSRGAGSGWIENRGVLPVARDTLIDVKYKDGLVMLNVKASSDSHGDSSILEGTGHTRRYARAWQLGAGSGTITHYRPAASVQVPPATRRITHAEMKKGMQVRYLGAGDSSHAHWNFVVGQVYSCGDGGPISIKGTQASFNWGDWSWELVSVETPETLDAQLADLRSQLNAIKTEKQAAEAEVAAARIKVNEIEARRVGLVSVLTKHGFTSAE